jgi:hypothetical protein
MERDSLASKNEFDPLPWTWRMPIRGFSGFEDIHDARAFYAQQYADRMRRKAEESLAKNGIKSQFYPYRLDFKPVDKPVEEPPLDQESAFVAYGRLRT